MATSLAITAACRMACCRSELVSSSPSLPSLERFTLLFPLWTLLAAGLSLAVPGLFAWVAGPVITWGLPLIMLGMGLGLAPADFRRVLVRPRSALIGVALQFLVMPSLAALLAWGLRLEPPLAVVLARAGGFASPLTALPGAISAVVHAVLGSLLASWWRRDHKHRIGMC
jgi:bile acid:Na+ symporter, BASS family